MARKYQLPTTVVPYPRAFGLQPQLSLLLTALLLALLVFSVGGEGRRLTSYAVSDQTAIYDKISRYGNSKIQPFLQQLIAFKGARRVPILKGLLALSNGEVAGVDGDEGSGDVKTDDCEVKAGNREGEAEEIVALMSKYQDAQVVIAYKMYNEMRARGAGETKGKGNGKDVQGKAVASRSVAVVPVN